MIRITSQIQEAELAFRLREREILNDMSWGRIRESVAEMHVARLRAAMATLLWLEKNEERIKAKVAGASS